MKYNVCKCDCSIGLSIHSLLLIQAINATIAQLHEVPIIFHKSYNFKLLLGYLYNTGMALCQGLKTKYVKGIQYNTESMFPEGKLIWSLNRRMQMYRTFKRVLLKK